MPLSVAHDGLYFHLDVAGDDGQTGTAIVHMERNGLVACSCPYWANAQDVTKQAATLLEIAQAHIRMHAHDDRSWPHDEEGAP